VLSPAVVCIRGFKRNDIDSISVISRRLIHSRIPCELAIDAAFHSVSVKITSIRLLRSTGGYSFVDRVINTHSIFLFIQVTSVFIKKQYE
jgi:hypothetical protein